MKKFVVFFLFVLATFSFADESVNASNIMILPFEEIGKVEAGSGEIVSTLLSYKTNPKHYLVISSEKISDSDLEKIAKGNDVLDKKLQHTFQKMDVSYVLSGTIIGFEGMIHGGYSVIDVQTGKAFLKEMVLDSKSILEFIERINHPFSEQVPDKPESNIVHYDFTVRIISGSLNGEVCQGSFSYDSSKLKKEGNEKISALEASFTFLGKTSKRKAILEFVDGKFKDIYTGGSQKGRNYGINEGFGRNQFGRNSESFIREGKSYFGYLDKKTYVDGAGTIEYIKR